MAKFVSSSFYCFDNTEPVSDLAQDIQGKIQLVFRMGGHQCEADSAGSFRNRRRTDSWGIDPCIQELFRHLYREFGFSHKNWNDGCFGCDKTVTQRPEAFNKVVLIFP